MKSSAILHYWPERLIIQNKGHYTNWKSPEPIIDDNNYSHLSLGRFKKFMNLLMKFHEPLTVRNNSLNLIVWAQSVGPFCQLRSLGLIQQLDFNNFLCHPQPCQAGSKDDVKKPYAISSKISLSFAATDKCLFQQDQAIRQFLNKCCSFLFVVRLSKHFDQWIPLQ